MWHSSVCLSTYHISIGHSMSIYLSIYPSNHPSNHPSLHPSIHPSMYVSIYIYLSIYISIYLSIYFRTCLGVIRPAFIIQIQYICLSIPPQLYIYMCIKRVSIFSTLQLLPNLFFAFFSSCTSPYGSEKPINL